MNTCIHCSGISPDRFKKYLWNFLTREKYAYADIHMTVERELYKYYRGEIKPFNNEQDMILYVQRKFKK